MGSQRVSLPYRIGIWEAHGRRCVYCGELIRYADLEIDHVLPAFLADRPEELARLLSEYGLPGSFDIIELGNLLPAHRGCNSRKSGTVFRKPAILFYLELAASRKARALHEAENAQRRSRGDRALAALDLALHRGELNASEVQDILAKTGARAAGYEAIHAIQFSDKMVQGLLSPNGAAELLDEPILPRLHGLEVLRMVKGSGPKAPVREVRTCREWATAVRQGYGPQTNYDVKEQAFFIRAYAFLRAILAAAPADTTFISCPEVGVGDIGLLPIMLLPYLSGDQERELKALDEAGMTVRDLVSEGRVTINERSQHSLSLTFDGMGTSYWEILRADLNSDGIEDILVDSYSHALGGTLGYGEVAVLTRLSKESPFKVLPHFRFHPTEFESDPLLDG